MDQGTLDALKSAAEACGDWVVRDFGGEFYDLWADPPAPSTNLLLVWDGMPGDLAASPVRLARYLTPYDWVVSFSNHAMKADPDCAFRVIVLDAFSSQLPDAFGCRMSDALFASLPWLGIVHLLPRDGGRSAIGLWDETELLELLRDPCLMSALGATPDAPQRLGAWVEAWIGHLARDKSHHDVNNLLGPVLLLQGLGVASSPARGRVALLNHLHRLGMTSHPNDLAKPAELLDDAREFVAEVGHKVRFVLIDDRVDDGWAQVVAKMLRLDPRQVDDDGDLGPVARWSAKGQIELWTASSADPIVRELNRRLGASGSAATAGAADLRFDLRFTPEAEAPVSEILLLDLRLGSEDGIDRSLLKRVAEIALLLDARATPTKRSRVIPEGDEWPKIDWDDSRWAAWLDIACRPESLLHADALGLLGSVVAEADIAYPVVVFSATGRRAIVESLRNYPTVLTDFEKPRVLGQANADWLFATAAGWRDAVAQSVQILNVRTKLRRLRRAAAIATPAGGPAAAFRYLTIALDETGDFTEDAISAIGGVIVECGATSIEAAQRQTMDFFEALRLQGANFYDHVPAYTELHEVGTLLKRVPISKKVRVDGAVQRTLAANPSCKLAAFRCVVPQDQYARSGFSEETFLKWLVATLELLLAEYLRSLEYNVGADGLGTTGLSIWLAQRTTRGPQEEAHRLDFDRHDGRISTLGGRSVAYAVLTKALQDRTCFGDVVSALKALKLRKIPYYYDSRGENSYVSSVDWYCAQCKSVKRLGNSARRIDRRGDLIGLQHDQNPVVHRVCRKRHDPLDWPAADFSVAQHLADASLSFDQFPSRELGTRNVDKGKSFAVTAGRRLTDFLRTGRLIDRGFAKDAFRLAYRHGFFTQGLNENGNARAPIEQRVVRSLAEYANRIDAHLIDELARADQF